YVAALGSYTPHFVSPLGVSCPVYPAKGYSATFDIVDEDVAPFVSLTDSENKVVYSRLGKQLRMAGTAELGGYSRALNTARCEQMLRLARELFPSVLDFDNVRFWSGLRPATPSNVPLIGRTKISNLYLNTGHGTLGWTMGAGSGKALADLITGQRPEPNFPFLDLATMNRSRTARMAKPARALAWATAALATVFSVSALAATDIRVWHALSDHNADVFEALVDDFNRSQSDVKVRLKAFSSTEEVEKAV